MNEAKLYKNQEPEPQSANEAAMAYESSCRNVDDFIASLPKEMMRNLVDFAIEEQRAGHCIPNSQVDEMINLRMGWI